jgi:hypothetical protein
MKMKLSILLLLSLSNNILSGAEAAKPKTVGRMIINQLLVDQVRARAEELAPSKSLAAQKQQRIPEEGETIENSEQVKVAVIRQVMPSLTANEATALSENPGELKNFKALLDRHFKPSGSKLKGYWNDVKAWLKSTEEGIRDSINKLKKEVAAVFNKQRAATLSLPRRAVVGRNNPTQSIGMVDIRDKRGEISDTGGAKLSEVSKKAQASFVKPSSSVVASTSEPSGWGSKIVSKIVQYMPGISMGPPIPKSPKPANQTPPAPLAAKSPGLRQGNISRPSVRLK